MLFCAVRMLEGLPVIHRAVLVQLGLVSQSGRHEGSRDEEEDLGLHFDCWVVVGDVVVVM